MTLFCPVETLGAGEMVAREVLAAQATSVRTSVLIPSTRKAKLWPYEPVTQGWEVGDRGRVGEGGLRALQPAGLAN